MSATEPLPATDFAALRRRLIFDDHKWDPQVGDTAILGDFALVLPAAIWRELTDSAERLAVETLAAEAELAGRPDLLRRMGLPGRYRRAVRPPVEGPPRVMRFDFHPTPGGWAISEVNSDVPGGYVEAGPLCRRFADHHPGLAAPPSPTDALTDAVLANGPRVALVHATAYSDDRQVMRHLADALESRGGRPFLCDPTDATPADATLRFFPAEWLPNLGRRLAAAWFEGRPATNPPAALLTQVKRFPLTWPELETPLPTWRRLLPETRDPRHIDGGGGGVLKPSLGRVGEGVVMPGDAAPKWRRRCRRWPSRWAAQRAFESRPVATPRGPMHACLGVFVIEGRAAGIYARLTPRPPVAAEALEVAVLLEPTPADLDRAVRVRRQCQPGLPASAGRPTAR